MFPEFRLETHFGRWEFTARHNLAGSDMQSLPMSELLSLANDEERSWWNALPLGYTQTPGAPQLRSAIAGWYERAEPDDVLCFTGAQEGIFCAMHALLGAGDHAVVTVPAYQSAETIPATICDVTGVPLRAADNWSVSPDDIAAAIRPNTRLIAVNFPNNPTGAVATRGVFDEIVELAARRGLWLFSDEVYRGIEADPARTLPHAVDLYDRALSLGVTSKALGLPGLRIGWIACRDHAVLGRMERVKHYLSICGSAPSEVLATIAIRTRDRLLARNRAITVENRASVRAFFAAHADRLEWYEPEGGCVMFPRYLGADGVEEFCRRAVEQHGVLLLPASLFHSDIAPVEADRFRLGYGRLDLPDALAALEPALAESH
ncbi:MAG TPA: aminotransferase class I/II-fold pyridoxal phosphate-dependent enzyme [Gemmatimonadaceae bacterium]|nr:aminotransferase class I/II-fold pyridoxal phosphate-dependent enzyme [Gemmatimonadaceae bacterium]